MSSEQAELIRRWHEESHASMRAMLPADIRFMGLELHFSENVMPLHESVDGDPYHQAVASEAKPGERVLDMGTGSGVSALLAARVGCDVVAVDINPEAVACAQGNAEQNHLSDRITFLLGDLFEGVDGDFDLIIFDPPFRWFEPHDFLERSHTDADYRTLTKFIAEAPDRLRADGRIIMNFGSSGDIGYLRELIANAELASEDTRYGEATKIGYAAEYFVIKLSPLTLPSDRGRA
jgi:release factor glutamine methyltransferase